MPRLTNEEKAAIKEQFKQQKMAEKLALKEEMKKKKQEEMQKRREEKAIVNIFFFSNFIIWYQRKMPWSSGHVLNKLVLVQFVALSKNCQLKKIQM